MAIKQYLQLFLLILLVSTACTRSAGFPEPGVVVEVLIADLKLDDLTLGQRGRTIPTLKDLCCKKIEALVGSLEFIAKASSVMLPEDIREKLVKQILQHNPKALELIVGHCPINLRCSLVSNDSRKTSHNCFELLNYIKDKCINLNFTRDEIFLLPRQAFRLDLSDQEDVIAKSTSKSRSLAFACALHPQLGMHSPAANLTPFLMQKICSLKNRPPFIIELYVGSKRESNLQLNRYCESKFREGKLNIWATSDDPATYYLVRQIEVPNSKDSILGTASLSACERFLVACNKHCKSDHTTMSDYCFFDATSLNAVDHELCHLTLAQALLLVYLAQNGFKYSRDQQLCPIIGSLKKQTPVAYSILIANHDLFKS